MANSCDVTGEDLIGNELGADRVNPAAHSIRFTAAASASQPAPGS
jgi:hypothetical protein